MPAGADTIAETAPEGVPASLAPRVLVVEPHEVCRWAIAGLVAAAGSGLVMVGAVARGAEAVPIARDTQPAALLLWLETPVGLAEIGPIREVAPGARVVLLARALGGAGVVDAIRAGAAGLVPASASPPEILDALRRAARGEYVIHPEAMRAAVLWAAGAPGASRAHVGGLGQLTPREREALELVAECLGTDAIATKLGVSRRTVESHLASIYRKLGVHGRMDAVRIFEEARLRAGLPAPRRWPPEARS